MILAPELIQKFKDRLHLQAAYKSVFNTPDGQLVLDHLMKEAGILNPRLTTVHDQLLIREGQRHIVLSILRILGRDAKHIRKQIEESMNDDENTSQHTV